MKTEFFLLFFFSFFFFKGAAWITHQKHESEVAVDLCLTENCQCSFCTRNDNAGRRCDKIICFRARICPVLCRHINR